MIINEQVTDLRGFICVIYSLSKKCKDVLNIDFARSTLWLSKLILRKLLGHPLNLFQK